MSKEGPKQSPIVNRSSASYESNLSGYLPALGAAAVLFGLYLTSLYSYNLFHSLAEIFSIAVAWGIFMIAWNSRKMLDNHYFLLLGVAFLFIGFIDLLHTLAYKGMGVFVGYDANLPTQLWIAGRHLQSASLLAAPIFIFRKLDHRAAVAGYAVVTGLLLASIFVWKIFPDCFIEGKGLTPFKKTSEYVIIAVLAGSLALLRKNRDIFDPKVLKLMSLSITATALSELLFTFYISVYGFSNLIGHYLKIIAYFLLYKAIIETAVVEPYELIFRRLKQSMIQLEAANKELETFSYSVSHDLKAPLRSIEGFSRIIEEDYGDRLDDTGKDHLKRVIDASRRMSDLIEHLLRLSQVARSELRFEQVDLGRIAREIEEELRAGEPQRKAEFVIAPSLVAQGDPRLIRIVLQNLLGNAWKFTANREAAKIEFGKVTVQETGRIGPIRPVSQRLSPGVAVYFVKDNGVGFDPAYADKLFAPFQRLHAVDDFPGTGIGLATVQRIIQRHGGEVWAEGKLNEGATFYFTLGLK